jgi:hypothetical protein
LFELRQLVFELRIGAVYLPLSVLPQLCVDSKLTLHRVKPSLRFGHPILLDL